MLRSAFCDRFAVRHPVVQAGMGGVARQELAAAVSQAGGLGCLGMVRESPALIASEISGVRERTDRPFAVNLIPSATEPALFRRELDVCIAEQVPAVVYFWDVDAAAVDRAKRAGIKVMYQTGTVAGAVEAEAAGADAVIAQGVEAGGHVHGRVSSLALIPRVVDAVSVPVLACGGVATGAGLAAALALGAQGIHCGTVFLATHESFAHDHHKRRVVAADATDTVLTDGFVINWPAGSAVRVLSSVMTDALGGRLFGYDPDALPREVIGDEDGRPIYRYSTDSPLRTTNGALEEMALFAGQSAGAVRGIEPAGEVLARIVSEAADCLKRLTADAG